MDLFACAIDMRKGLVQCRERQPAGLSWRSSVLAEQLSTTPTGRHTSAEACSFRLHFRDSLHNLPDFGQGLSRDEIVLTVYKVA